MFVQETVALEDARNFKLDFLGPTEYFKNDSIKFTTQPRET